MKTKSHLRLKNVLNKLSKMDYIKPEDVPNIDLYMDQVLTFLDQKLGSVQETTEEKPMTKTMINNYTKNQLLPPPEKKKYSRDHVMNLIFIYYMKSFMSMHDIKSILDPINEIAFGEDTALNFSDIYEKVVLQEGKASKDLMRDVMKKYNNSRSFFPDSPESNKEDLQDFAFLCSLSFDVFVKKLMIENFIRDRIDKTEDSEEINNSSSLT